MEWCGEVEEQCTRTCEILRVWSTERVPSSLNGATTWSRTFEHKDLDGGVVSRREQALVSMEQQQFEEGSWQNKDGRRQEGWEEWERRSERSSMYSRIWKPWSIKDVRGGVHSGYRFSLLCNGCACKRGWKKEMKWSRWKKRWRRTIRPFSFGNRWVYGK